jgi:selenide,water dikinase
MKLGHCICDPRRPCPCEIFNGQGICPCAGERPDSRPLEDVRLTELVHNAGCASKIAPGDLEQVLSRLGHVEDPDVLLGTPAGDDAGVYRLADGTCLVQTVDVMTPCVDDPRTFGRICAANCLSDVYAMGGVPRTALSVLAFPSETLDGRIMFEMMAGAMEIFAEAGVSLIGGHSIKDEEIKLGFAVTGMIDANKVVARGAAKPGDRLVLTKKLGAGVLNFCRQVGRDDGDVDEVARSMATLNKDAAEAMEAAGVSAATDVTGFGLFGHLVGMVRASGVTAEVWAEMLPAFDGAVAALCDGVVPGAIERNREYVADDIAADDDVPEPLLHLGFDAQTSGGMLMSVPAERHEKLLAELSRRGVPAATVGRIAEASSGRIFVTRAGEAEEMPQFADDALPHHDESQTRETTMAGKNDKHEACCADVFSSGDANAGAGTAGESLRAFGSLLRSSGAGGAIDERTKELINFSLVLLARCGPCLEAHLKKAKKMGISQAELDEAAWCAVAMGGAPVKMFYQEGLDAAGGSAGGQCC